MRRRSAVPFLLVAAILTIAGCSSDKGPDLTLPQTDANVTGSFNLVSANGQTLPYTVLSTTTEIWNIATDRLTVAANNTWVDTTLYQVWQRDDGSVAGRTTASAGTYTVTNGQINFTMTQGGSITWSGSVTGNTMSAIFSGVRYVYTR